MSEPRLLHRSVDGREKAPVRIVHLGLGNFFRAHTAWYTEHAPDNAEWGIAAFSGRTNTHVEELTAQDCVYTLVEQSAVATDEVISSVVAVHAGNDLGAWRGYFADPDVVIVTSTITEGGYVRDKDGGLDTDNEAVKADIAALKDDPEAGIVSTAPAKFVAGLLARRAANAGKITFVPCDNVVDSGAMAEKVIGDMAKAVDSSLAKWVSENVEFVTTMVDRITPKPTPADIANVAEKTGRIDKAPVITEPFSEWVLSGTFAGPRPAWDIAGAQIVDDIVPFEHRKLWLLNGSHSLMAYAGPILGKEAVYEAITDPTLRGWVEEWWDAAVRHLPLPEEQLVAYRAALLERFSNPAIKHKLSQISADGSQKIPIRFIPTLKAERSDGRMPLGATRPIAAWILHLRGFGNAVEDVRADEVKALAGGDEEEAVAKVLAWLGVTDAEVSETVRQQMAEILSLR